MRSMNDYWNECYATGKDFRFLSHRSITRLLDYIGQESERTCLDIGCGTGQLTRELIHRGYRCTGIDVSPKAISIASSLTVSPQAKYLCLDVEKDSMQALSRSYGLITCKYVYAFIADKTKFLGMVADRLSDDGTFFMIAPLTDDEPIERRAITVDYEQTMAELRAVFSVVETFPEQGAMCFVGRLSVKDNV